MAGVVVLYVIAPKPREKRSDTQPTLARIELKCKNDPAPVEFAVRLINGSPTEGYSAASGGDWTFPEPGVAELLLEEPLAESDLVMEVWVVDLDYNKWDPTIHTNIGVSLTMLEMPGTDLSPRPQTIKIGEKQHVRFQLR